jgi:FMN phosphatase YigB (HAD superfamily)
VRNPEDIKAVIFDVGGTLAYDEPGYAEGFAAMVSGLGYPATATDYRAASNAADADIADAPRDVESWLEWRPGYHRAILLRLGVPGSEVDAVLAAVVHRFKYYSRSYVYPESRFVLRSLRWAGYTVGIISNVSPVLPIQLEELEITPLIEFAIASDTFGISKPDPRIFEEGLRLSGSAPENTMYVGDGIDPDVLGSSQLGIMPVLIDRSDRSSDDAVAQYDGLRVRNLVEILDWLGIDSWDQNWLNEETGIR